VPVTIGLYGVGEILFNASERYKLKIEEISSAAKLGLKDTIDAIKALWNHIWLAISSTVIGFFVGILPGVGATPATFICYGIARRTSRHPERFGKGEISGVIAPETAHNAAGIGSILPMLVLGVPGSPTAAILMAGVFMWGFIPGPQLFTEQPEFVWAFVASLYVANVVAFIICMTATPLLAAMLRTPYAILAPVVIILCVVGAYAIQNSMLDVWLVLIFGVIGFVLRKLDYPLAPLIVALVLGELTETALRQSLIMSDGSMGIFFTRGIALPLTLCGLFLFLLPLIQMAWRRMRPAEPRAVS
jgi:putative tricarboxylic transport membrane protein